MLNLKQPPEADLPQDGSFKPNDGDIAALAYQIWTDRGRPIGSPDEDWFIAEDELKRTVTP